MHGGSGSEQGHRAEHRLLALALEGPFREVHCPGDVARFQFLGEERCGTRGYGEHRIPEL
jgi:hypothetical protein